MKKLLIALLAVAMVGAVGVAVVYACCGNGPVPPPTISVEADPAELWPPNHKMVDIELIVTTTEATTWYILSVSSDEPDNAIGMGDGNTDDDIVIGTDKQSLQLRAERCGTRKLGRTYTITLVADGLGGTAITREQVFVPFSMKGKKDE